MRCRAWKAICCRKREPLCATWAMTWMRSLPRKSTRGWATAAWAAWRRVTWIPWPRCTIPPWATAFATTTEYSPRSWAATAAQREVASSWLRLRNVWEMSSGNMRFTVRFGGRVETESAAEGETGECSWVDTSDIYAVGFDQLIPGNRGPTVNHLRLWSGRAITPFHIDAFNAGDYAGAVREQVEAKNLSRVLYPDDSTPQGKELRLKQQYFFVSASLQDILATHLSEGRSLASIPDSIAIQLNDTHPAVAIPELMRLLIDEHGMPWSDSWDITTRVFSYTNHTLLPEALETWPVAMFERLLPRHLQIIYLDQPRFSAGGRTTLPRRSGPAPAPVDHRRWRRSQGTHGASRDHRQSSGQRRRPAALGSDAQACVFGLCRSVSGSIHQRDQRDRGAPLAEAVESRPVGPADRAPGVLLGKRPGGAWAHGRCSRRCGISPAISRRQAHQQAAARRRGGAAHRRRSSTSIPCSTCRSRGSTSTSANS